MPLPSASIVIPTYNRAPVLQKCLNALAVVDMNGKSCDVIIIDNNSNDSTFDTVSRFAQAQIKIDIRCIREEKQGISYARNRGVLEAKGEIVCFLDDDSPPTASWLINLLKGFSDPRVGCIGGPSILDYQGQQRPLWLQGDLQGLLSGYILSYEVPTQILSSNQFPIGCNMAIRKSLFSELGLFKTDLGRNGLDVLAADDTEMVERISKHGYKVIYEPNACVYHLVSPERLEKEYIYRIGRGRAATHIILTSDSRPWKSVRWFASDAWYAARMALRFFLAICSRKRLWFDDYMGFWMIYMRLPLRIKSIVAGG